MPAAVFAGIFLVLFFWLFIHFIFTVHEDADPWYMLLPIGIAIPFIVWLSISACTTKQVYKTTYCLRQQTWSETYITYTDKENNYKKIKVGGAVPAYRVVEYEDYYYGVKWNMPDDVIPVESQQEYIEHLLKQNIPTMVMPPQGVPVPVPDEKQA